MTGLDSDDEDLTPAIDAVKAELAELNAQADQAVHGGGAGTDLVPRAQSAADARAALAAQRATIMKIREQVAAKAREMKELQDRQVAQLERRMKRELEAMERHLGPLRDQLRALEEAVWTVNLYLGRDEQIVQLRDGEPAGADTPVTIRQLVLAMDEECAVAAEQGGIDSLDHERFDDWLREDWAHVEQVIPEPKGVVACVPRHNTSPKRYDDERTMRAAMEGNEQTYFLIRNGEKLFRTWTDFSVGSVLVPREDEFTSFFRRKRSFCDPADIETDADNYVTLAPGTDEWLAAEDRADFRRRHYMRVALILEGLLHRTTVFHPVDERLSFTDRRHHESGAVRFVLDAERTLGTGRQPFDEWLAQRNAQLRPGMRIVGSFQSQGWWEADRSELTGERSRGGGHRRVHPKTAPSPTTGAIYRIEDRRANGDLVIRYPRGEIYDRRMWVENPNRPGWGHYGDYRPSKQRASATLRPDDDFIIPYDLVTVAECEAYLSSRLERHAYVTMFPVLKAVIRAKRAEAAVEAPYRTMLAGVLAREAGVPVAQAQDAVAELVDWYKTANRIHRPLVLSADDLPDDMSVDDVQLVVADDRDGDLDSARPVRLIVAEYKRRLRAAQRGHSEQRVADLLARYPDALVIARKRSGPYVVLTAEEDEADVFVCEREFQARTGAPKSEKRWKLPGASPTRWTILHESERWAGWDRSASRSDWFTGPERDQLAERLARHFAASGQPLLAVTVRFGRELRFDAWVQDQSLVYDASHPLTGKIVKPSVRAVEINVRRRGSDITWTKGETHAYSWREQRDSVPWDTSIHEKYGRLWHVVWQDADALATVWDELDRYQDATRHRNELEHHVKAALKSLADQWLAPRYEAIWRKFLEDYADPSLWHGHRRAHRNLLPRYPHAPRYRTSWEEDPVVERALRALIEAGDEPWGMTVADVVAVTQADHDRYQFPYTSYERTRWRDTGHGTKTGDGQLDRDEIEALAAPEDLADMVFVKDFELVEPWPPEPSQANDDTVDDLRCEGCGEYADECSCPVEGEDFDVEGDVEQAALPAGEPADGTG